MGLEASSDVKGTLGTFNPVPSACNHGIVIERRRSDMSGGNNGGWQDSPVMSALRDIPLHRLTSGCKNDCVSDFTASALTNRAPHAVGTSTRFNNCLREGTTRSEIHHPLYHFLSCPLPVFRRFTATEWIAAALRRDDGAEASAR
jgi:hypothetical protein